MKQDFPSRLIDFAIPLVGIGIMVYYDLCAAACAYLKGTLFGIDLKYVGIGFMTFLFFISMPVFPADLIKITQHLKTVMLSGALGGEVWLVRFQVVNSVFCPFCLAFALCVLVLFIGHLRKLNYYLAVPSFLAGILTFVLFFQGAVLPLYSFSEIAPSWIL